MNEWDRINKILARLDKIARLLGISRGTVEKDIDRYHLAER